MALIQCPDCGTQISSQADTCIKCGRPMVAGSANRPARTIEATGKDAKTISLIGAILIVAGLILTFGGISPGAGVLAFIVGLIMLITGRIVAWWKYR